VIEFIDTHLFKIWIAGVVIGIIGYGILGRINAIEVEDEGPFIMICILIWPVVLFFATVFLILASFVLFLKWISSLLTGQ
jgi:hypothetical protein